MCCDWGKGLIKNRPKVRVVGTNYARCEKHGVYRVATLAFHTYWQSNVRRNLSRSFRREIYPKL